MWLSTMVRAGQAVPVSGDRPHSGFNERVGKKTSSCMWYEWGPRESRSNLCVTIQKTKEKTSQHCQGLTGWGWRLGSNPRGLDGVVGERWVERTRRCLLIKQISVRGEGVRDSTMTLPQPLCADCTILTAAQHVRPSISNSQPSLLAAANGKDVHVHLPTSCVPGKPPEH